MALESAPLRGILYMLLTITLLAASDAAAKWLAPRYAVAEIIFVRSLLGLPLAALLVALSQGRRGFVTHRLGGHVVRTGLMLVAWGAFIYALRELPLADAFTIAFAAPLFMILIGRFCLRETVDASRWIAVLVGFAGVLIVLRPSGTGWSGAAGAALLTALAWAVSTFFSRRLAATEASTTLLFYYMALSAAVLALGLPWYSGLPRGEDLPVFALSAVAGTAGHWCMAQAFRFGEISLLAPFEYLGLLWAVGFGYWIFGDVPNPVVLAGGALIIAGGISIARFSASSASLEVP